MPSRNNPSPVGQPVDLIAAVTPSDATGTVEFYEGATLLGSSTIDDGGVTFLTVSNFTAGIHTLTAKYLGNFVYAPSTSPAYDQDVEISLVTRQQAQPMVTKLAAEAIESGVRGSWAANADLFANLELQRASSETGAFTPLHVVMRQESSATVAEDLTAEPGRSYFYRVLGTTKAGVQTSFGPVRGTAGAPR